MEGSAATGSTGQRRRRLLQIVFVFVNLALVETHIPGLLWLAIGSVFWIALVLISAWGSSLVCGTMCWVGAIQDFAEPIAHSRIRLDPRWGKGLTLALLFLWIPVTRFMWPDAAAHDRTPLDLDPNTWQRHLFGVGLALTIPLAVTFLGKRGICRYLCPFNSIVGVVRRALGLNKSTPVLSKAGCAESGRGCSGCASATAVTIATHCNKGLYE